MASSLTSLQFARNSESGLKSVYFRESRRDVKSPCKSYRSQAHTFLVCITLMLNILVQYASATSDCSITVLDLPYSEELSNPCALVDDENLHRDALTEEARESVRRTMIEEMTAKASLLLDEAETVLSTNAPTGCSSLHLPLVAAIPKANDISGSTQLKVLRLFYTSLLKHAAHLFFMADQLKLHSEDGSCASSDLANNTLSLASGMRNLVCGVRFNTLAIQDEGQENSFEDLTGEVLEEQLSHQSLCSRRSLRDCQTIRSTISVLQALLNYLQTIDFNRTTVFGEL